MYVQGMAQGPADFRGGLRVPERHPANRDGHGFVGPDEESYWMAGVMLGEVLLCSGDRVVVLPA
jgi:hypothetical protein